MTSVRKELQKVMDWQDNFDNQIQKMLNEFRELYTELTGKQTKDLTFGQALGAMKRGMTVRRRGYADYKYTISDLEYYKNHSSDFGKIDMDDILAEDWEIV